MESQPVIERIVQNQITIISNDLKYLFKSSNYRGGNKKKNSKRKTI